jgi:HK97 family phage major capsid protein
MDFAKKFRTLTVLPFLAAVMIASALAPLTNVVRVNARGMGTEYAQPWKAKVFAGAWRAVEAITSRWQSLIEATCGHPSRGPALMGAAVLLAAIVAPEHAGFAMVGVMGSLKLAQSKAAKLEGERKALVKERSEIGAKALTEDRAMTPEEKKTFAELGTKITAVEAQIEDHKDLLAAAIAANEIERDPKATPAVQDGDVAVDVRLGENRADKDPKRGFADHRDFLGAVMAAGRGKRVDARLKPLATQGSDEQGEYSDPAGGFLVPHGVAPGILSIAPENDPLDGLITAVPMTAPTVSFNARVDKNHATSVSGGFTVTRRPETVDGTASRGAFEQVVLTANEEFGLAFASERIINDSPTSFVAIIQAGMASEYVANAMNERINGSGTGERQGALNAGCKIEVAKESNQNAATIIKENIDKMAARCYRYSGALWLANHNTRPQLKSLVQVVGTGGNAVPYFTGVPGGAEYLDNRPIFFTEFAKALGTAGDLMLLVPSEYLEGTYQSEQYAESIHVRFAAAERGFRFYRRNDGQWWWRSALTPKNGSTLSPVVTLATRA